jgi:DNA-binding Lrp family transcriptional regulator
MDHIDRSVIECLVSDGRATYASIGGTVGLSVAATKRRIDRLLRDNVIRGFTAVIDPAGPGLDTRGAGAAVHQRNGAVLDHAPRP